MLYENYPDRNRIKEQLNFMKDLDEEEKDAIGIYTSAHGYTINKNLRAGAVPAIVGIIDGLFDKVPPLTAPIVVWRDMDIKLKNYLNKGYTSTTTTSDQLAGTSNMPTCCQYQITVPVGARVLPLQMFSQAPSESEILLPRDGAFTFTGERVVNNVIWLYLTFTPPGSLEVKDTKVFDSISTEAREREERIKGVVEYITHGLRSGRIQAELNEENQLFEDKVDISDLVKSKIRALVPSDQEVEEALLRLMISR